MREPGSQMAPLRARCPVSWLGTHSHAPALVVPTELWDPMTPLSALLRESPPRRAPGLLRALHWGGAFGVGGTLCAAASNSRGLVATLAGTDGTAIGYFEGMVQPDVKRREGATEDGKAMGSTLGALAGTPGIGHNQASAFGSRVCALAGSKELSIDSRRSGVISNDASSNTVLSGGTAVDATSIGGTAGVVTSGGGTAASAGAGFAPSMGGRSDGIDRSIKGGETSNVLVHLPRGIFLNKPIYNLPGARLWGSTGVSTDSATRVVDGRLPPRRAYATAHHAWNYVDSAAFIGR
jgi:hypothetical protein